MALSVGAAVTVETPADPRVALHVAAIRCIELANGVGYLARRYADRLDEHEKSRLEDAERDLREVAESLTARAEAA